MKTTVIANGVSATVELENPTPVIISFSVQSLGAAVCTSTTANMVCFNGNTYNYETSVLFQWSAINADTYRLIDPTGVAIYSGASNSVNVGGRKVSTALLDKVPGNGGQVTYTLEAYRNGVKTVRSISPNTTVWEGCSGGCSN